MKLGFTLVEMLMFGWDFEVNAWSRFWNCYMFKICELWTVILWYELNPRVGCAFGNVIIIISWGWRLSFESKCTHSSKSFPRKFFPCGRILGNSHSEAVRIETLTYDTLLIFQCFNLASLLFSLFACHKFVPCNKCLFAQKSTENSALVRGTWSTLFNLSMFF